MLSLHTNAASLSAMNTLGSTNKTLSSSMTKLSTGFRINSAMDDAAGLQIATRLKAQNSGMTVAMRNTQNGISMMQTAEGALSEVSNMLVRMKDLATQASDATAADADKKSMQAEFDSLAGELSNIIGNTAFGGAKLMKASASDTEKTAAAAEADRLNALIGDGTAAGTKKSLDDALTAVGTAQGALDGTAAKDTELALALATAKTAQKTHDEATAVHAAQLAYSTAAAASNENGKLATAINFQIGASTAETMSLDLTAQLSAMHDAMHSSAGGYNSFGAPVAKTGSELTADGAASQSIDKLQAALDAVGEVRSALGAASNRLEHTNANLSNMSTTTQAAYGRIMDVDYASETANMTKNQMLMQASTSMLKQSASMSQMVGSLLQ